MKLLNKVNRSYAIFSLILLLSGSVFIYVFVKHYLNFETEEKLQGTRLSVIQNITKGIIADFSPFVEVRKISDTSLVNLKDEMKDTLIDKDGNGEGDSFIQYRSYYQAPGAVYSITIRTDDLEKSDLVLSIGIPVFTLLLIVLLLTNIMVNRISRSIWNPFYQNLRKLKTFSITDKEGIALINSEIDEFKDLNSSLTELTDKLKSDYQRQKEFSENMAHELQTPLAILSAKIESLLQRENLDEEILSQLDAMYKTVNRLSRLNKSLILLSRLESTDYEEKKQIRLESVIAQKIEEFAEILAAREIILTTEVSAAPIIEMNEDLLDILLTNLLTNAIRYNIQGGSITIFLTDNRFRISNTGKPLQVEPGKLFDRFEKNDKSGDSPGLGLTIVRQICELNNLRIHYTFDNSIHSIEIFIK